MHASILIEGYQKASGFASITREVQRYLEAPGRLRITFVINSPGGETRPARELIDFVTRNHCVSFAKIYRAESAAAFIALSAEQREIVQGGFFRIDLGGTYIPSNMLLTKERIPPSIIDEARVWRATVLDLLKKRGFPQHGKLMAHLLAQNELSLTAEECLEIGFVQAII